MSDTIASSWGTEFRAVRYGTVDEALTALCTRVEQLAPQSIAGLTICNPARTTLERAIFPKLPASFSGAITAIPLDPANFGSCVYGGRGEIITCPDLEKETRFDPRWQRLCLDHDLRSLQSRPVYLRDGKPFATFVLAYREPVRKPIGTSR